MHIKDVWFAPARSAYFFDDQAAIKAGAEHDGFTYAGDPITHEFTAIRQAGEAISVLLELENGSVAMGDCAAVQYSGAGGRDPLFLASAYIPFLEEHIKPLLMGRELDGFREASRFFDTLQVDGRRLHTALRYGISQALLDAHALANNLTMAEVVCREWNLPVVPERVPLFGQTGDDRYSGVDKMIIKGVDVLPHGLINNIPHKLGTKGEKLKEYIRWMADRIRAFRTDDGYVPDFHIDVYGTIGIAFDYDLKLMTSYLAGLAEDSGEFPLYIEGPVDMGEKARQIEVLKEISDGLTAAGSPVKIVADEWCNTYQDIVDFTDAQCCAMAQIKTPDLGAVHNIVDAVLYCNRHGMESYQGGTCNETDISAKVCTQIALAARPQRLLVKPGMGFDEGFTIVNNEMARTLTILENRKRA